MSVAQPSRPLIERIAAEEAARDRLSLVEVLGAGKRRVCVAARKRAWVRLVKAEGFPILGVSRAWGCDRRGVQRAVRAAKALGGAA